MDSISIWQATQAQLERYVRSKVKQEADIQDILQDVYVKMELRLHQLEDESKAAHWLFRIAQNAINDHFRERSRKPAAGLMAPPEEDGPLPSDELTEEVASWLPLMLEALPEKYREALRLTEIEGLTQQELADHLGLSLSGAKSRVQRGRQQLRQMLLSCCEVVTDNYGHVVDYHRLPLKKKR